MAKHKISKLLSSKLAKLFKLNLDIINIDDWTYGLNVELEHGTVGKITNVTNDNPIKTAKIALAHLEEDPKYYQRLKKMEASAEKYWSQRKKPNIYMKK